MKFEIDVPTQRLEDGLAYAREKYNDALPDDGTPLTSKQYGQWVMARAIEGWVSEMEREAKLQSVGLAEKRQTRAERLAAKAAAVV